ncbi:MAG TPA: hypothetical protein VFK38_04255 [Candidatus Limnocylindrales bacterium]|nr:hypothetical protein [Candidatus Limnocylindrales bacterium]
MFKTILLATITALAALACANPSTSPGASPTESVSPSAPSSESAVPTMSP